MTDSIILKEACIEAEDKYWDRYFEKVDSEPDCVIKKSVDENIISFLSALNFKTTANGSIKLSAKPKKIVKITLIAAIIVIFLAISVIAVSPLREFIINVYDDCTEFVFNTISGDDYLYAEYNFIPESYKLFSDEKTKTGQRIIYKSGEKQIVIDSDVNEGSKVVIDTENAECGEIPIDEFTGYYSITSSSIILVWSTGENNHMITAEINSNISLETV